MNWDIILLVPIMLVPVAGMMDLICSRRESEKILFQDVSKQD
jgi:hypothetical protein